MIAKKNYKLVFFFITILPVFVAAQNWKPLDTGGFVSTSKYPNITWILDTLEADKMFECDTYNYFNDFKDLNSLYNVPPKDSIKAEKLYRKWLKEENQERKKMQLQELKYDTDAWFSFLPEVMEQRDIALAKKVKRKGEKFKYKSLEGSEGVSEIYSAITDDAVVCGRIVGKRMSRDSTQCLHLKSQYIIEVEKVEHAYFPLQVGDRIMVFHLPGYEGGCGNQYDIRGVYSHLPEYKINEISYFYVNRNSYQSRLRFQLRKKLYRLPFSDTYCSQAFEISYSEEVGKIRAGLLEDTRSYIQENLRIKKRKSKY
jgi:hypothetical protein